METIGWLGGIMLAVCAVPQAFMSWRQKHSNGISNGLLWLWGGGEIFALIYVTVKLDWPLIFNYAANIFVIAVIGYYKYWPHDSTN